MANYQSYVICSTPRSGSTLLCKLLAATGKSGDPESHFHSSSVSDWLIDFDLDPKDPAAERDVLSAIFDAARERGTGNTGIFGLRLQRKSFSFLIQQMSILHPGFSTDLERFQAAFGDTLFIYVSRTNKLEQAISLVTATQTGLWHMAPDGVELERLSEPKEPVYDANEIASQLAELTTLDKEWEDWFIGEKLDPLRIAYDELSDDPVAMLIRILDRLDLDRGLATGIRPAVAKLADATSRRWMERFLSTSPMISGPSE